MDIFSNLQVIGECLLDQKRVGYFARAIKEVVKPGDIVLDVGTGSGIMALLAAKAGAKKVYAVEIAEDVAQFAKRNVEASKYASCIEVIHSDIREFTLPVSVDVVTAELLDTCLIAEQQVIALNHLKRVGIVDNKTSLIPFKVDCAVEVLEYNFNFYGFDMPFVIQARNYGVNKHIEKVLSGLEIYQTVDFHESINTDVNITKEIKITHSGKFNAIRLKSRSYLSSNVNNWGTSDMDMPVIIPIEPVMVEANDVVTVNLKYKMSEGYNHVSVLVSKNS